MASLEHSTLKHLAEVFGGCQEEIIGEWRLQAATLLRLRNLDKPTITNHLPDLVAEITRDLAHKVGGTVSGDDIHDSPPGHGRQRFRDGLDVGEVVAEYNLLRVAFITIAERHALTVVGEAAHIINQRIDGAVRMAVMAFAEQQEFMRKEQEEEHLAFIAHDLRTPLNAASLMVEELGLSLDPKTLAENADLFEILRRNLLRVEAQIQQVLATQEPLNILGGSFRPVRRVFELWPLVQRLLLDLHSLWFKEGIEVLNEIPPTLTVFADAGLLSQVFQNLLSNAFKYAAHGKVIISAQDTEGTVTCTVTDDGAGIPPQMLGKVFDKMTTDPDKDGTGLGLAIVTQVIEAHGGTVHVESVLGEGAKFSFTIPPRAE